MKILPLIALVLFEAQKINTIPTKQLRRIQPTKPEVRDRLRQLREQFRDAGLIR